ncbi:MAG: hypothetical protein EXR77_06690 [Myxococcales bacterium]|nr:hypothetical protein [Myxococcales bacterium]
MNTPSKMPTLVAVLTALVLFASACRQMPAARPTEVGARRSILDVGPVAAPPTGVTAADQSAPVTAVSALSAAASVDNASAASETAVRDVLVWRSDSKSAHSWWLQGGDQTWELVAERKGLWSAGRDDIFGLRQTKRRVQVCDPTACAAAEGECVPTLIKSGPFEGRIYDATWVGLLSGRITAIGSRLPTSTATALGSPGLLHRAIPVGQLDEHFWFEIITETWSCGAMNGRTVSEARRVLIPDGLLLAATIGTTAAVLSADAAAADDLIAASFPRATGHLAWQTVQLAVSASGEWQLQHVFRRDEPTEAGFDIPRRATVPATAVPEELRQRLERAPALAAIMGQLQASADAEADSTYWGWSEVNLGATQRAAAQQRFLCAKDAP